MKTVVVRRNRAQRMGVRFLGGLGVLTAGIAGGFCGQIDPMLGILCEVAAVVIALLVWSFERLRVTFDPDGILWKGRLRPWAQVERVWARWSSGEGEVISIRFRDGKTLRLRMIEENAGKARNMICAHCSIEDRT